MEFQSDDRGLAGMNNAKLLALAPAVLLLGSGMASYGAMPSDGEGRGDPGKSMQADAAAGRKSVGGWVKCDGIADDSEGLARAFAAAGHSAFTLVIDCPLRMTVGMDIARPVFIDDGTTVEFSSAGKLIIDNVFIPAFVIANSSNITLTNWNVEYDASLPIDSNTGGYEKNGQLVSGQLPGAAFNDLRITPWLTANRHIVFDRSQGPVTSKWSGPTNVCAVFFITGPSSNLNVSGMRIYAPASAGGDHFIPVVFSLNPNFRNNQSVNAKTPSVAQVVAVPHDIVFSNISLDGTYMGWVGGLQNARFEHIRSRRYGDLQDAQGANSGGIGKYFAPPHLFYFSYSLSADPALINRNIHIEDVEDEGVRVGAARDVSSTAPLSGNALSLKIGCVDCTVNNYRSARADGFMDVLSSDGLTVSNVIATYDSGFLNNIYPGIRFPQAPYRNVKFDHVLLADSAETTTHLPIENASQASNQGIHFGDVHITMNRWSGSAGPPLPAISGQANDVSLDYSIKADDSRIVRAQTGSIEATLMAVPTVLRGRGETSLTWTAKQASGCSASGAWSGPVNAVGKRTVQLSGPGTYDFVLTCQNDGGVTSVTLQVTVAP